MNVNQEGFDRRLVVVKQILQCFNLKSTQVTPLAYAERCPFPYNNFSFKVDLACPATCASFPGRQPGTSVLPPEGVSTLVVRLSNPLAEGLNNINRVQNEVASLHLARQSFEASGLPPVVPAVYAWAGPTFPDVAGEEGFGWLVGEFKPGADLDTQFPALSMGEKEAVLWQIAEIVSALQRVALPQSVTEFGALTFDENGQLVSGQMPLLKGGPWSSYDQVWTKKLLSQLEDADKSSLLQGWNGRDVRKQINDFLTAGGVTRVLHEVDTTQRVLIHGDLTMNNMLFDNTTKRITALLDFDWACVSHPCDEYLSGLWDIGGGIHDEVQKFQSSIITGDYSSPPSDLSDEELEEWKVSRAWNSAISKARATRPSTIAGVKGIQALQELGNLLCPFSLGNEVMLKRMPDEEKSKKKEDTENQILEWLLKHSA
ncbi:hypothetical protein DCS_03499 [Drechmeria coniospora]|uniref:non-specific serine/threonine protein kinase n=1 Tax=Drechmeria coniospora TaxID=98403 RepID=A0A151GHF4_DRECN|nr:hypothetical protein DCS_03499 [Drechmeria coniospora]KYK56499.1 hypothetical protein DCS_03499 [Drechmeria coniospora]ODA76943.1 hypothetical protein RJ55_07459 [Drechmeria coniospora]